MSKKQFVVIEEMSGTGKNSGKPYHMLKLASPETYENHRINYDPNYIDWNKVGIKRGDLVLLDLDLRTPYDNTQAVCIGIQLAKVHA